MIHINDSQIRTDENDVINLPNLQSAPPKSATWRSTMPPTNSSGHCGSDCVSGLRLSDEFV